MEREQTVSIECVTKEREYFVRIVPDENNHVDFQAAAALVEDLLATESSRDIILSFPRDFMADATQMGYLMLWGEKLKSRGRNLFIVSPNARFREHLSHLVFAFQIGVYQSETELEDHRS